MHTKSFNKPSKVDKIVCCDFDETYLPFGQINKEQSGISCLEHFIENNNEKLGLIIGWITGSSLTAVLRKSKGYITKFPHFIASSLGTEFYWVEDGNIIESQNWIKLIDETGFDKNNIQNIVDTLEKEGLRLDMQNRDYQGKYMGCYYYRISERERDDLATIEVTAARFKMKVLYSKCNPAAGDPEDSYDIHFVPFCCGKKEALLFLQKEFNIPTSSIWAFGDSFNDFEMLHCAGNAFLVGNADPEAKKLFPSVLTSSYCTGIREKLQEMLI